MIQGKDLLVDIYHAGTRDVENTNQTLGSEMSVREYSKFNIC